MMSTHDKPASLFGRNPLQNLWGGLLLVVIIGLISWWLAQSLPDIGAVTIAIIAGIVVGNIIPNLTRLKPGIQFAEKRLLPLSVALLGVELQLATLVALGPIAALVITATLLTSFATAWYVGGWLGYSRSFRLLIGAGNGVCGSSAVAATAVAIDADETATGISISVVNLLGTLGIFALPAIISALNLSDTDGGLLVGGSLQAVGQVVAAGFAVNDTVGTVGTLVKMGRVLMLGPVVIVLASLVSRHRGQAKTSGARVPLFIVGFFTLSLIASSGLIPQNIITTVATAGKFLLVVAMAAIGLHIQLRTLFRSGPRAFLFGLAVSIAQISVLLTIIMLNQMMS